MGFAPSMGSRLAEPAIASTFAALERPVIVEPPPMAIAVSSNT
jgi:hypothetical protein